MELQDVYQAVKDVEARQIDMIAKQAEHNVMLVEAKSYSLALFADQKVMKAEMDPIKKHVHLMGVGLKLMGMVGTGVFVKALIDMIKV